MTSSMQTGHIITDLSKDAGDFFDSHHHGMELLIWIQSFFWRQTIWGHSTCFCVAFIKTTHWNYNFLCIFKVSRHSIIFSILSQPSLYGFCLFYYKLNNKLIQLKWGHHIMTENMQNMISVNLGKTILLQSFFRLQM